MSGQNNLEHLAQETQTKLCEIWDKLGVESAEREEFLARVHSEVEAIFQRSVESQRHRQEEAEAENEKKMESIRCLAETMSIGAEIPSAAGVTILAFGEQLGQRLADLEKESLETIGEEITTTRIQAFRVALRKADSLKDTRRGQLEDLRQEIISLWEDFGCDPQTDLDYAIQSGPDSLGFDPETMEKVKARAEELRSEKARREERIKTIGEKITLLWQRLETPEDEQTRFLESHNGVGDNVIDACESYLAEKEQEFQERLGELIGDCRSRIQQLWEEVRFGSQQRQEAFEGFFATEESFSDELYQAHESYIQELEEKSEKMAPILRLLQRRDELLDEREEYEALISDPSRLLSRGGGATRLREEKLERRVKKELPMVTKKLFKIAEQWEEKYGPLVIDDEPLRDRLLAEEEEEKARKEQQKESKERGKQQQSTRRATEQSMASTTRTRSRSGPRAAGAGGGRRPAASRPATATRPATASSDSSATSNTLQSSKRANAGTRIPRPSSKSGKSGTNASRGDDSGEMAGEKTPLSKAQLDPYAMPTGSGSALKVSQANQAAAAEMLAALEEEGDV